ncbi:MAG TPA: hypothetical protein VH165_12490, partial [Kofleriaceae bacterium]|nr:hypothetical protein [Kofleriaceae bacterium]
MRGFAVRGVGSALGRFGFGSVRRSVAIMRPDRRRSGARVIRDVPFRRGDRVSCPRRETTPRLEH